MNQDTPSTFIPEMYAPIMERMLTDQLVLNSLFPAPRRRTWRERLFTRPFRPLQRFKPSPPIPPGPATDRVQIVRRPLL